MRRIRKQVFAIALSTQLLGPIRRSEEKAAVQEASQLDAESGGSGAAVWRKSKQAPRRRRTPVKGLVQSLETMVGREFGELEQPSADFAGETKMPGKMVDVLEPHTEIIRKGKASKPNEFGKLVKIQEAETKS